MMNSVKFITDFCNYDSVQDNNILNNSANFLLDLDVQANKNWQQSNIFPI